MTPQEQALADRLAAKIQSQAEAYVLDPAAGHRAGYRPGATIIRNDDLLSAGPSARADSHILHDNWLEAIASRDLGGWRWRIDRGVMPNEVQIIGRL